MRAPSWLGPVLEGPYTADVITLVPSALAFTGHFSATGARLLSFAAWCVAFFWLTNTAFTHLARRERLSLSLPMH